MTTPEHDPRLRLTGPHSTKPKPFAIGQRVQMRRPEALYTGIVMAMVAEMPDGLLVAWDTIDGDAMRPVTLRSLWANVEAVDPAAPAAARPAGWWMEDA
jgi:hypothetical protein